MQSNTWQTPPPDRKTGRLGQVRRGRGIGLIPPLAALLLGAGACSEEMSPQPEGQAGGGNVAPRGSAGAPSKSEPVEPVEPMEPPECVPAAEEDLPDADFTDTNCDGIDGDRSRAVFVAPHGSDDRPGTLDSPVATLTRGIELARQAGKSVYACTGTYPENLVLEDAAVNIYGGYDCGHGWRRGSKPATIAPAEGRPLTIRNVADPMLLSHLRFVAADVVVEGDSSVAALVVDSLNLRFEHVEFEAGDGAPGLPGEVAIVHSAPPRAPDGRSAPLVAECYTYTPDKACSRPCTPDLHPFACCATKCVGYCHTSTLNPECEPLITGVANPFPQLVACATDTGSTGRSYPAGGNGGNGHIGVERTLGTVPSVAADAGASGGNGAPATDPFGAITADGEYVPTNAGTTGLFGKMGTAGQGGNGGLAWGTYPVTAYPAMSGAGGRGGAAGCGGYPGQGGGGGGASIALIAVRSGVELEQAILRTGAGGDGGVPSAGGSGQVGGQPGQGGRNEKGEKTATDGKPGTAGGRGGHGGPGGGGPSVGIVAVGSEPVLKATLFDTGVGGLGADPVPGSGLDQGAAGLSRDVHVIGVP